MTFAMFENPIRIFWTNNYWTHWFVDSKIFFVHVLRVDRDLLWRFRHRKLVFIRKHKSTLPGPLMIGVTFNLWIQRSYKIDFLIIQMLYFKAFLISNLYPKYLILVICVRKFICGDGESCGSRGFLFFSQFHIELSNKSEEDS